MPFLFAFRAEVRTKAFISRAPQVLLDAQGGRSVSVDYEVRKVGEETNLDPRRIVG